MMKLINRSKQSPVGRRACDVALAAHHEKFGDYGRQKHVTNYTVVVDGVKAGHQLRSHRNDRRPET